MIFITYAGEGKAVVLQIEGKINPHFLAQASDITIKICNRKSTV